MTRSHLPLIALATLACAMPAAASAKVARCVITSSGEHYTGPCTFVVERGGTFTLGPVKPRRLILGATDVSVAMKGDGTADVRGLTTDGINSEWGEARRSRRDRACWVGSDFRICVY